LGIFKCTFTALFDDDRLFGEGCGDVPVWSLRRVCASFLYIDLEG